MVTNDPPHRRPRRPPHLGGLPVLHRSLLCSQRVCDKRHVTAPMALRGVRAETDRVSDRAACHGHFVRASGVDTSARPAANLSSPKRVSTWRGVIMVTDATA
jgi:hypothetical protein